VQVRKNYEGMIKSTDRAERQLGTAMWVIDKLALRVGGEKGEDEADTVGCCSLRKEHLHFNPDAETHEIELEFLGKDSMQYKQNINFATYGELGKSVYRCLKAFCSGKKDNDDVFETLDPPTLNKHLTSLMKGLTAKVFRTYNASVTLEKELPSPESMVGLSIQDKVRVVSCDAWVGVTLPCKLVTSNVRICCSPGGQVQRGQPRGGHPL